jgi:hypothetical protein
VPDSSVDASTATADAQADAGAYEAAPIFYAVCPDAMGPIFPSIYTEMLSTASCGTLGTYDCHSSLGALPVKVGGTGSLLDLSLDASTVYAELLGDGSGYPSTNARGDAGAIVPRVAPGNADGSMLYIKLALPTEVDPRYGEAMPPRGLVCPASLDAVKRWIDDGAKP